MKARWHKRGTGLVWMFLLLWSVACQKVELPTEEPEGTEQPNGGNGSQTTPGADENPLPEEVDVPTVSDIFSIYDGVDLEADYETWVAGYIVGSCTGTTISSASFSSEKASNSNILIADAPGVTDVDVCMPVELEKGSHLRDDLNLSDNQENLGRRVALYGLVKKYFRVIGLKGAEDYEWMNGGDEMEEPEPTPEPEPDPEPTPDPDPEPEPEPEPTPDPEPTPEPDGNDTITIADSSAVIHGGRLLGRD